MSNQALVSIITIFFNEEQFLEEAIASVFAQEYKHWEILLVDDGSTDNSTAIAQNYARNYPKKVHYLSHPNRENRGMSASRNLGIEQAQGDFIAFLDADDRWLSHKLTEQLAILCRYPDVGMIYGQVKFWHSWSGKSADQDRDYFLPLGVKPDCPIAPPNLLSVLWGKGNQKPIPSNVLFRHDILIEIGRFEEQFRGWAEDTVFFTKIALHYPVYVASNHWVNHREFEKDYQDVVEFNQQKRAGDRKYFVWAEQYLRNRNLINDSIGFRLKLARFSQSLSVVYFLFQVECRDLVIYWGRKCLPKSIRHWLWIQVGRRL